MAGKKAKKKSAPIKITSDSDFKQLCAAMDEQHILFCDHYLITLNATDSYKKAGYKASGMSAVTGASRLLTFANIQKYIDWKIKQRKSRMLVDEKYVLDKYEKTTKQKITDFFIVKNGSLYLKDFKDIPDDMIELIEEISETVSGLRIKLISKSAALDKLGSHLGMWNKDKQGSGTGNKIIIKLVVAPAIGNVVIAPPITPTKAKDLITEHLINVKK